VSNVRQVSQFKLSIHACLGYWCTSSVKTICDPASEQDNYYCPLNEMEKQECAAGKYNIIEGTTTSTDCKDCPPGKYCANDGGAAAVKVQDCDAGYYCTGGQSTSLGNGYCTTGYYCPVAATHMMPCPKGKYCDSNARTEVELDGTSEDCTAGYLCEGGAVSATGQTSVGGAHNPCPAGFIKQNKFVYKNFRSLL
jgi:hypothetical protein